MKEMIKNAWEMFTEEEKNAISHRGKALRAMAAWLQEHHGK